MARDPRRCAACGGAADHGGGECPNPHSPFRQVLGEGGMFVRPRPRLADVARAWRWSRDRRAVLRRLDDEDLRDAADECQALADAFAAERERRAV